MLRTATPAGHHWHTAAGLALLRLGRHDEARDAIRAAVRANPRFDMNHLLLAAAHEASGDHEAAQRSIADALAITPHLTVTGVEQMMAMLTRSTPQLFAFMRAAGLPPG